MSRPAQKTVPGATDKSDRRHSPPTTDLGSPVSPLRPRPILNQTSSSSSSSGSSARPNAAAAALISGSHDPDRRRSHSGEILTPAAPTRHRRSGSGPVLYSSTASSPSAGFLPTGNICPSGKIGKPGAMFTRTAARSDVLGTGTGNYGHGSVMRGGATAAAAPQLADSSIKRAMASADPEEVKRAGNELYRRGAFAEALRLYDRAIALCPENAAYRSNRAAALAGLRRLGEAVKECEEAVRLDPAYTRAHQRLVFLHIRLGNAENARKHFDLLGPQQEPAELQKLIALEKHLNKCKYSRNIGDWNNVLKESDSAIAAGADSSPLIVASRAEALLHLHKLDEADGAISGAVRLEALCPSCSQTKFFGMLSNSYIYMVRAKVEMAFGRFDSAIAESEKSRQIDPRSVEVTATLRNVRSVLNARDEGNQLFKSGNFAKACSAYGEGLKLDPSNAVLYCNRAACRLKLGQWERSLEDCNEALKIRPNYTKALHRRADSNYKLEHWADSVRDYEILRKDFPDDIGVAQDLFRAQVALETSRSSDIPYLKSSSDVEEVTGTEQFQAAISSPGVHVVFFMESLNQDCIQISPFVDTLSSRYQSINFLKIDIHENLAVLEAERVTMVPSFRIYKNSARVKDIFRPSQHMLEYFVKAMISKS